MEEFWKDITLSPSHHPISAAGAAATAVSHTTILQEFLALPTDGGRPPHPPATALSLNTHPITPPALPPTPHHHFHTRKRPPETDGDDDDRRHHERLIKNRESAARTRARKRAYTYQLEMKIAHLKRENDKLRRQKEKLSMEVSAGMPSKKKNKLSRTLTAPF
ncbi:PREDICTED: bZIP transcription factor 27-like [Ipomoea nil]|uniref:bZIP transcription factor 27-like n=1 Tax=Ipomoea nil TaxID=35883 RepID=UPI0009013C27|nr:PREDICTED: bZIP transcription factor 27-like [Ipomoea nil]